MAGRKDKNTVDYFPHYVKTDGKTMTILENSFGHLGYAVWYKTLELLGSSEYHFIDLRKNTDLLFLISRLQITEQQLNDIYNLLASLEAIDSDLWNLRIVFSENFIKNIEDAYKRRSISVLHKYDLCKHKLNLSEQQLNKCIHKSIEKSKEKNSKEKESIYREFAHLSLSTKDFEKLSVKYSKHKIDSILNKIENYKNNKNYKSLYLTALNWLEKESSDTAEEIHHKTKFQDNEW